MYKDPNQQQRIVQYQDANAGDDRTGWAYFVTIYANERQPHFAIPELEAILKEQWQNLPQRFPSISLDRLVILPDRLHCILWIKPRAEGTPSLPEVVGAYKSISAVAWLNHLKENNIKAEGRIWQKGYYDRIIRNKQELENARRSIENNPSIPPSNHIL